MIRIFLLCFFVLLPWNSEAQSARTDERVEFVFIVARMAEFSEFSKSHSDQYNKAIDDWFLPFQKHPAIETFKLERQNHGIGFDAVACIAPHLMIEQSNLTLDPRFWNWYRQSSDRRWDRTRLEQFVIQLSEFYHETDFAAFYASQADFYKTMTDGMNEYLEGALDTTWLDRFFGRQGKSGSPTFILSCTNSYGNYGMKTVDNDGTQTPFVIMCSRGYKENKPVFTIEGIINIGVHELCHSYCNPLVDQFKNEFKPMEADIHPIIKDVMAKQAYPGWRTILYEALVRGCVIKYIQQDTLHNFDAQSFIDEERKRGFFWMQELVDLLDVYENNRDKYPSLESFMPEIIRMYQGIRNNPAYAEIFETGKFDAPLQN